MLNVGDLQSPFLHYLLGDKFPFAQFMRGFQESIDRVNVDLNEIHECDIQSNVNSCVCFKQLLEMRIVDGNSCYISPTIIVLERQNTVNP